MKWWPRECRPGDMIRVRIGHVYHHGVFVSEDEVIQFGMPPVNMQQHMQQEHRVCATDIETFACGSIIEVAEPDRKEAKTRVPAEKAIAAARARLGEGGYDIVHNNCEHFACECCFGRHFSEQSDGFREKWRAMMAAKRGGGAE